MNKSLILLFISIMFFLSLVSATTTITDSLINTTGNVSANYLSQFFEWSGLRNIPNIIYSIWTTQNDNSLLVSNGTAIGYNSTIFNNSVIGIVNTMANNLTVNNSDFLDGFNSTYFYPYSNPSNFINSTFNSTYDTWLPNYTLYSPNWYNHTLAVNTLWGQWFYNMTQPFTDWLSTFIYNYNQTTPAINDINSRFWNRTQTWNITQLYNKSEIDSFNTSWSSTYNATYHGLINNASYLSTYNSTYDAKAGAGNFNCTSSNVLQNVTTSTSGITGQCVALPSGDGGWLPNNATENNNYNTTGNITANYGFFSYLGSLASRITKGWFTSLDISGGNIEMNTGNITNLSYFDYKRGICVEGIVDLSINHSTQCNATGTYIIG